jgi:hypothetical protein
MATRTVPTIDHPAHPGHLQADPGWLVWWNGAPASQYSLDFSDGCFEYDIRIPNSTLTVATIGIPRLIPTTTAPVPGSEPTNLLPADILIIDDLWFSLSIAMTSRRTRATTAIFHPLGRPQAEPKNVRY